MIPRLYSFLHINSRPLAAIALSIYGLYLRYVTYAQRGFSPDELNQLGYTAGPGLLPFWRMYTRAEITAFPGDYLLTVLFVKLFGTDKWLITLPHIIATMIGFYLFYLVCARYIKTLLGLIIAFLLFCSNFTLAYHAFEFRPYAILPTLALAVFLFSEHIVHRCETVTPWQKFLIGGFFFLTVGFHAYGILMIALSMSFHVFIRSKDLPLLQIIRELFPFSVTLAAFAVPLFIWYFIQNPIICEGNLARGINPFDFIPNPLTNPNGFLRSLLGNLVGMKKLYPLLIGAIVAFVIPCKDRISPTLFLAVLVIIPIELILLSDLRTCYWFVQRQFVWVMPFFALWLAWCWDSVLLFLNNTAWTRKLAAACQQGAD